jgi:two-component system KDP operon response regulator KdpE
MTNEKKILIIDDEIQIRRILRLTLESHEFKIVEASNGKDGLYQAATCHPDIIILDLGLPDIDGMQVLSKIREWSEVPIIILSVRDEEEEKVEALDSGADDYVTKPFGVNELIARIQVALRHAAKDDSEMKEFCNGNLRIDLVNRIVYNGNEQVKLTATEYSILLEFVKNAGRVLTYQHLIKEIWGPHGTAETTQSLRVHMAQLRKKLESDPSATKLFITESGIGYRMRLINDDQK